MAGTRSPRASTDWRGERLAQSEASLGQGHVEVPVRCNLDGTVRELAHPVGRSAAADPVERSSVDHGGQVGTPTGVSVD